MSTDVVIMQQYCFTTTTKMNEVLIRCTVTKVYLCDSGDKSGFEKSQQNPPQQIPTNQTIQAKKKISEKQLLYIQWR